jgi:hypothetical protein
MAEREIKRSSMWLEAQFPAQLRPGRNGGRLVHDGPWCFNLFKLNDEVGAQQGKRAT